jgi:hypothetical protein
MSAMTEVFIPLRLHRRGGRQVMQGDYEVFDVNLIEGIGRAFYWQRLLDEGVFVSASDLARAEGMHFRNVCVFLRLTLLAPDIIDMVLAGKQPRRMSLVWFQRNPLPVDWGRQRAIVQSFGDDA